MFADSSVPKYVRTVFNVVRHLHRPVTQEIKMASMRQLINREKNFILPYSLFNYDTFREANLVTREWNCENSEDITERVVHIYSKKLDTKNPNYTNKRLHEIVETVMDEVDKLPKN
jgi:hypothetical protein